MVFISGASRGIGHEFARQYLEAGEQVIAACRKPKAAKSLMALKKLYPKTLKIVELDVCNSSTLSRIKTQAKKWGAINLLINNAGVLENYSDKLKDLKSKDLMRSLQVNALGPMLVTQALVENLKKAPVARIVQITSLMGSMADNKSGGAYSYRMSKAALNMFNVNLSLEFPKFICVAMHPGWVKTDMGGKNALMEVSESVRKMRLTIDRLDSEKSGQFLKFDGSLLPF